MEEYFKRIVMSYEIEDGMVGAVQRDGMVNYYFAPEHVWVMDWAKWKAAFSEAGYDVPETPKGDRSGILVVNEKTADDFILYLSPFAVTDDGLRSELQRYTQRGELIEAAHLFPQVLIDFDHLRLRSVHSEGLQFDLYVPKGWQGQYEDFYEQLPASRKYWIDKTNDFLEKFGAELSKEGDS